MKKMAVTQAARKSADGNAAQTPVRGGDITRGRRSASGIRKRICRDMERKNAIPALPRD